MIPNPVHRYVNDEGLNFSETGFLTGLREEGAKFDGSLYLHRNQASEGPGIHPIC